MENKISLFKPVTKSSRCEKSINVDRALNIIKGEGNSFVKEIIEARESGKHNPDKKYKIKKFGKVEHVNFYNYIKSTKVWCFSWLLNLNHGEKRTLKDVRDDAFSGYMYFDVDDIFIDIPLDEIKELIYSFKSVKGVWKSISNEGLGFLVKVDGLNKENVKSTWSDCAISFTDQVNGKIKAKYTSLCFKHNNKVESGEKEGQKGVYFKIDPAVKDYTRLNIISYDPDILIRDDSEILPVKAITPENFSKKHPEENKVKLTTNRVRRDISDSVNKNALKTPSELEKMHLDFTFYNLYNNQDKWSEGRLSYVFHRDYFAACNKMGVDLDVAFDYLVNKKIEQPELALFDYRETQEVYDEIAAHIYHTYEDQFGYAIHENENYDGYEIIDINVAFKGTYRDAQLFMSYMHYDISKKSPFDEKNIYHFVKAVKEKGISFKNMLSFLIEKKTNDKVLEKAKWVYSNTYIAFGIILKEKDEHKKKRLDQSNQIAASKNKKADYSPTHSEVTAKFVNDLDFNKKPEQGLHFFLKRSVKYALFTDIALKYLKELKAFEGLEVGLQAIVDHVMLEMDYRRGISYIFNKKVDFSEYLKYKEELTLNPDQYLSDLELKLSNREILYSSTGSGKTTMFLSKDAPKCIFLVPTTALADSNGSRRGVKAFHEKKRKIDTESKIVSTYSSFPALIRELKRLGADPYKYRLVVDEAHNFVSSASDNFRLEEMSYIYKVMDKFKQVIHLTGTWFNVLAPKFQNYSITKIEKKNPQQFQYIHYKDKHVAVEKSCDKDGVNVIFLQSKKFEKQLGTYREYFKQKGWDEKEMLFVNAGTKGDLEIKRLLKKNYIPDKYKLVFITSFAAEGLDINNDNIKSLHFASNEHPMMMQQIANRFRKKAPEMIYLYKNVDKPYNGIDFNDRLEEQYTLESVVNQTLELVNNPLNKPHMDMFFNKKFYHEQDDGSFEINYLSIANSVYNKEKAYANNNEIYMVDALAYYGWEYKGRKTLEDKAEKSIEKALKLYRKIEKEKIYDEQKKIVEGIKKNESLSDITQVIEKKNVSSVFNDSNLPDFEYSVRKKILKLAKYTTFEYALKVVEKWLINTGASNAAWKRMMGAFEIKKRERFGFYNDAVDIRNGFYKSLREEIVEVQKRGDKKKLYFDHHLISFINKSIKQAGEDTPEIKNYEEALDFITDYVFIDEGIDTRGKRRISFGQIKLINEENYLINAIKNYVTYMHKTGSAFTKDDFKKFYLEKVNNLIYASNDAVLNEITTEKVFEILQSFCDIEHSSRRQYVITNVGSSLLGKIDWRDDLVELYDEDKVEFII